LVGETVNASLHAADNLFERLEVAAGRLPDELAGGHDAAVLGAAHGERFGRCLRMHQR
jgi:hypothetical protein